MLIGQYCAEELPRPHASSQHVDATHVATGGYVPCSGKCGFRPGRAGQVASALLFVGLPMDAVPNSEMPVPIASAIH